MTKTWRNSKISQGHWEASHVRVLCTSLKEMLYLQGVPNYSEYEKEVKLMAYQVITTCRESRDEAAYQAQVAITAKTAKTAKTPPPASPATSSSAGPSSAAKAAAPSLLPRKHTIQGASAEQWISRDIRPRQATIQPPDNNNRGMAMVTSVGEATGATEGGSAATAATVPRAIVPWWTLQTLLQGPWRPLSLQKQHNPTSQKPAPQSPSNNPL